LRVILARGSRTTHVLTSAFLAGVVESITAIGFGKAPLSAEWSTLITLGILVLVASMVVLVVAELEGLLVPLAMASLGVIATVVSASHTVVEIPPGAEWCYFPRVNRGFPLPWNYTYGLSGQCPAHLSPLFPYVGPDMLAFALDVVYYVAIGLAIIQFYRGIRGMTIAGRSSRVNNMI
jgi:hypothetical protein